MDRESQAYLAKVVQLLEQCVPMRLSISSISRRLGINRSKTIKYLEILEMIGEVTVVPYGRSKLYTVSHRIPYSSLLDVNDDAIVILDERGRVRMVNNKFLAMVNFTDKNAILGRNIIDLDFFTAPLIKRNIKMFIEGSPYEKEIQYIADDIGRIYRIKLIPTMSNRGTAGLMIDIGDITAQKNNDEKCIILDQKLKTIFDGARIGIIFIDANGNVRNVNKAAFEMLGVDPSHSVTGENISKLLGSEDWVMMKNNFITEADIACDFNDPLPDSARTRTGIGFFEITLAPIRSSIKEDLIVEYAILLRDIMAERDAMIEVNTNESRYKSFFENTCNGMYIYDRDGCIKDINKAAEKMLRVSKDDVIGKKSFEVFPDTQDLKFDVEIDKVFNQGIPQYLPPMRYRKEKNEPWFSHYIFKLPWDEIAIIIINVPEVPASAAMGGGN